MAKKSVIIGLLVLTALFLIACEEKVLPEEKELPPPLSEVEETEQPAPGEIKEEVKTEAPKACSTNSDCSDSKSCIDGTCKTLADLYRTDCEKKCTTKEVSITTSDGTSYEFAPDKGSYTAAGGLEWKVEGAPTHCPEEKELVPFRITKYTYGKLVSDELITVREGATSKVLTHPTITTLKFTLKVTDVECS